MLFIPYISILLNYLHGICDICKICPKEEKRWLRGHTRENFHLKRKALLSQADSLEAAVPQVQHGQHGGVHGVQVVPDVAAGGQERFPPRFRENFHPENGENATLASLRSKESICIPNALF